MSVYVCDRNACAIPLITGSTDYLCLCAMLDTAWMVGGSQNVNHFYQVLHLQLE